SPNSLETNSFALYADESAGFIPSSGIPRRICATGIIAKPKTTKLKITAITGLPTTKLDHDVSYTLLSVFFLFLILICLWNILINAGNNVNAANTENRTLIADEEHTSELQS